MPFPKPEITEDNYLNSLNDQDPAEKTAQVAYNPNKELTPDDYLNRFFSRREPEPELDTKKIDRIQRMGRLNTFGRTFSIIGDGLGLGLGANVKRRTPDTTAPMLYQSYEQTLDKHKAEKDAWKVRDYRKELEDDQLGLGNARRKEDKAYQAKVHDDSMKVQAAKNAQDWAKYLEDLKRKDQGLEISQQNADANTIRANKPTGSRDKSKDPITINTNKKSYTLDPAEVSRISAEILNNQEALQKQHPGWFEKVPVMDKYGRPIAGQFTQKLNSRVKPIDLARDYLIQEEEKQENESADLSRRVNSKVMLNDSGVSGSAKDDIQAKPIKLTKGSLDNL